MMACFSHDVISFIEAHSSYFMLVFALIMGVCIGWTDTFSNWLLAEPKGKK